MKKKELMGFKKREDLSHCFVYAFNVSEINWRRFRCLLRGRTWAPFRWHFL